MPANIAVSVWKDGDSREKKVPKGNYRVTFSIPKIIANTIQDQTLKIERTFGPVQIKKVDIRAKAGEALVYAKLLESITVSQAVSSTQAAGGDILSAFGIKKIEYIVVTKTMLYVAVIAILLIIPGLRRTFFPWLTGGK